MKTTRIQHIVSLTNHSALFSYSKFKFYRHASDMAKFREALQVAKEIIVLSGAGISAESGVPTFRGKDGSWRMYHGSTLDTAAAFRDDPSLVWEFYHYRRELVLKAKPNAGHLSIAQYEKRNKNKKVTVITQNVDGLHARAGSKNVIELHGNLFKTRCTKCNEVLVNFDSPICKSLENRGSPNSETGYSDIPVKELPHCKKPSCGGLLRPHVVWFGEVLDSDVVDKTDAVMSTCNVCVVVGTSSVVFPAALYPSMISAAGAKVAEFNIEPAPVKPDFDYYFEGPSGTTLPQAFAH